MKTIVKAISLLISVIIATILIFYSITMPIPTAGVVFLVGGAIIWILIGVICACSLFQD